MRILITICGRGGSKGIPNKNIKLLNGKPLIYYTIKAAKEFASKFSADIALSTDSDAIKNEAAKLGLITSYTRPKHLATDSAGKISVIQDIVDFEEKKRSKQYNYILDLDISSPLRSQQDLDEAFLQLQRQPDAFNIFSVNPANRNPYFNMVEEGESGFVKVVKQVAEIKSRQSAPKVYDMNASFYIFRRCFFEEGWEISTTSRSLAYVMNHICFDLDHPLDFIMMELLLKENLLDFEL